MHSPLLPAAVRGTESNALVHVTDCKIMKCIVVYVIVVRFTVSMSVVHSHIACFNVCQGYPQSSVLRVGTRGGIFPSMASTFGTRCAAIESRHDGRCSME